MGWETLPYTNLEECVTLLHAMGKETVKIDKPGYLVYHVGDSGMLIAQQEGGGPVRQLKPDKEPIRPYPPAHRLPAARHPLVGFRLVHPSIRCNQSLAQVMERYKGLRGVDVTSTWVVTVQSGRDTHVYWETPDGSRSCVVTEILYPDNPDIRKCLADGVV